MSSLQMSIVHDKHDFTHPDACRIYDLALKKRHAKTVIVDLKRAADATTSAFARLVLLRRRLLKCGRDLRLIGLTGRAARIYEFNRLAQILPVQSP